MSRKHQYHRPRAPDHYADGSGLDLEFDYDELNPMIVASKWRSTATVSKFNEESNHIPLQQFSSTSSDTFNQESLDLRARGDEQRFSSGSVEAADDDASLLPGDETSKPSSVSLLKRNRRKPDPSEISRSFLVGQSPPRRFPPNAVSNAKYTSWSFLPRTLYNEFSFFFNMYFLLVALSQIIPSLRIGYLSTYIAPLVFVLAVTLGKEALDDIGRRRRDAEANKEEYAVLRLQNQQQQQSWERRRRRDRRDRREQALTTTAKRNSEYSRLQAIDEEEEEIEGDGELSMARVTVEEIMIKSRDLKVGDVMKLNKDQRVPADVVLLKTLPADLKPSHVPPGNMQEHPRAVPNLLVEDVENASANAPEGMETTTAQTTRYDIPGQQGPDAAGEAFIRTDQLDGETDWKLRLASPLTQRLDTRDFARLRIIAGGPSRKVNDFVGTIEYNAADAKSVRKSSAAENEPVSSPLTIDNTAWANTVLASNATVLAVVVYTGAQTRQALSTAPSRSKSGLLEHEINNLTKILCALTLTLSIVLVIVRGAEGRAGQQWYVAVLRFLVLFSTIVPISLRVNLDMGKTVYARFIERDNDIQDTVVRTSTIPEELGRIEYLLSDKTGTLTQNEMDMRKIHVGTVSYANEAMEEVRAYVRQVFSANTSRPGPKVNHLVTPSSSVQGAPGGSSSTRSRREISSRVRDLVLALALCHNVTPTSEEVDGESVTSYQASSPDEIAIVRWTEDVGLRLLHRDRHHITLQSVDTSAVIVRAKILEVFPFTSASKRMGIILQFFTRNEPLTSALDDSAEIWFYEKGADTVMCSIVMANDWLDEETANMAREGLRTLVVGRKRLSKQQYQEFASKHKEASMCLHDRDSSMAKVVSDYLERNLELLGVTGVEDKLQMDVKPSLELLRNAGVKIWMLTGDKVETARCVAVSAKLVSRTQYIHTITQLSANPDSASAQDALTILRSKPESTALLIDGDALSYYLGNFRNDFINLAVQLPAVIACRCSPTQKADIAYLIRESTKKRVACIGDGGNDVSMIQAADVGVGIVGKEGRQASLAADFSITSFHHLTKLLVWHGRNSYKRSAKLAQFVIHRGLIISVCQTFYSIATDIEPHALYRDWLLVGYATVYTMAPVFSLVLDRDVDEGLANLYPELYKELTTGKSLSYRTFFVWVAVSIYQGGIIQGCSQLLVDRDSDRMVSVSFTVLVLNELVMVAFEIVTWHWIMYVSILGTAMVFVGSIPFLGGYFDLGYMWSWAFAWRVAAISALSLIPPYSIKLLRRTLHPPNYRKVQGM